MKRLWIGLALVLRAMSGWAQTTNEDLANCWSRGTTIPAQTRVQNCTQLIVRGERGEFSRELLAGAYSNRGIAYRALHLTDHAIDDYTRAIELKPSMAEAYYNRGNAY